MAAEVDGVAEANGDESHKELPLANGDVVTANGGGKKLSASEKRRLRRKLAKQSKQAERAAVAAKAEASTSSQQTTAKVDQDVEIEYVSAPREFDLLGLESAFTAEPEAAAAAEAPREPDQEAEEDERMGLGSTGGLGLGATPGLGSASDMDMESTGGLGLGATAGLGASGLGFSAGAGMSGFGFQPAQQQENKPDVETIHADFERVFQRFASAEEVTRAVKEEDEEDGQEGAGEDAEKAGRKEGEAGGASSDSDEEGGGKGGKDAAGSKRKRKLDSRLKIAELKQQCPRPEVVEVWDATASDPKLLVWLKAYRNTVPVPRHWSQKRKYLQGKRGLEKPAFALPDFIEATGIGSMRAAYHEKEGEKKLKQKQRDRMQPKMGKLDIDYQVLHDAFFKHQTKPALTKMGELYYEGKEFEAKVTNSKPGILSEGLRKALGMSDGSPPPWLINMQRYGPPPSYPDLKVPGLNAPIPPGAQFGYQPGGWGKPPVDEDGNPLYGDVFAQAILDEDDEPVDKTSHWGDLESDEEEEEEEEESEEESEDEGDAGALADGYQSLAGTLTSGISSLPSGMETPEVIDLRKGKAGGAAGAADGGAPKPLYTVLEQREAQVGAGTLMGSDHTYVVPGVGGEEARERRPLGAGAARRLEVLRQQGAIAGDVVVELDPEELEGLDEEQTRELYEQKAAELKASKREDFSDMVAAKAAQQKRKAAAQKDAGKAKKAKESFKF